MCSRVLFELPFDKRRRSKGVHRPAVGISPSTYCQLLSETDQQENREIKGGCQYRTDFSLLMHDNRLLIPVGSRLLGMMTCFVR